MLYNTASTNLPSVILYQVAAHVEAGQNLVVLMHKTDLAVSLILLHDKYDGQIWPFWQLGRGLSSLFRAF